MLQRQKDEKVLLLKEQRETEQKIRDLLNFVADIASTYNSSSGSSSSCCWSLLTKSSLMFLTFYRNFMSDFNREYIYHE